MKRVSSTSNGAFRLGARFRSLRFALMGLGLLIKTQHNARIHLAASILVIATGLFFRISLSDWGLLIITIALVWMAEALNTAVELLCDVIAPEFDPVVKKAKDIAAAGVLIAALGSIIIGVLVLGPYLLRLLV